MRASAARALGEPGPHLDPIREATLARRVDLDATPHRQTGDGTTAPGGAEDAHLLAAAGRGDATAFRALVDRHLGTALAIARRMLRDEAEAEDVAQEAMLRMWRSGGALELGDGGLKPWLRRVVSNLCIDRVRAGRRTDVTDDVPEQEVAADQIMALEGQELAARVDAALRRLPDRQRQALALFHYEGLSQIEVGQAMGITDEAVESLLARARRALKAALKDEWRLLLPDQT